MLYPVLLVPSFDSHISLKKYRRGAPSKAIFSRYPISMLSTVGRQVYLLS